MRKKVEKRRTYAVSNQDKISISSRVGFAPLKGAEQGGQNLEDSIVGNGIVAVAGQP
jgi:hypothetical protein